MQTSRQIRSEAEAPLEVGEKKGAFFLFQDAHVANMASPLSRGRLRHAHNDPLLECRPAASNLVSNPPSLFLIW